MGFKPPFAAGLSDGSDPNIFPIKLAYLWFCKLWPPFCHFLFPAMHDVLAA